MRQRATSSPSGGSVSSMPSPSPSSGDPCSAGSASPYYAQAHLAVAGPLADRIARR